MKKFVDRLWEASRANRSLVCVGLDPDPDLMAIPSVLEFNRAIVDATQDLVCAYKPNLPFYEALGREGIEALEKTVSYIRERAPGVVIVGDGKRGDIASTNVKYAKAMFETWGFDAATVNAYGGGETLEPFLDYPERGVFVWCRSSNPGAAELQDLRLGPENHSMALYEWMAQRASAWNSRGNVGLVVGATYPEQLRIVRAHCPGMPILVPGVGAQAGDLQGSVKQGLDAGPLNILVSSSRGITYASRDEEHFAQAAREAAGRLKDSINRILTQEGRGW